MSLTLEAPVREALAAYLLAIADDELIIGHRHSEWTGFAPDLESDVALSSIAQEEIGHAKLFYEQVGLLRGGDPDSLTFNRPPEAFRNAILTERPNGDWGYSIIRMFLYDRADTVRLAHLADGAVQTIADLARALHREERYHVLFGLQWVQRLGGTHSPGRGRMQTALDRAWPEAVALFEPASGQDLLNSTGVVSSSAKNHEQQWREDVTSLLEDFGLRIPGDGVGAGGRAGRHSEDLGTLVEEMTSVRRTEPSAQW